MKSSQRAKSAKRDGEPKAAETEKPTWFLGKEVKGKPAKTKAVKVSEPEIDHAGADEEVDHRRRPTQLEAYMRYAKMREPSEDDMLAPITTREYGAASWNYPDNENDGDTDGRAPARRSRRRAPSSFRMRDAVLAGLASIAIGTLAGAVVYDRTNNGELSSAAMATLASLMTGLGTSAEAGNPDTGSGDEQRATASLKKPITTASIDVTDAWGSINSPIPLSISAEPDFPDQDIVLRLSGLPPDAYLSAGTKAPGNAWLLRPGEAQGVKLMVPSAQASPLLISVDAIERRTGDLASPPQEINVSLGAAPPQVDPVSAPPVEVKQNFNLPPAAEEQSAAAQPIPAPSEAAEDDGAADSDSLMRNGDKLLGLGDFTAARAFFSKARELGNKEAALRLGQTYDPVVFSEKNVQGLKPDPALALRYYLEARTNGIEDADGAISGLESWLKQ